VLFHDRATGNLGAVAHPPVIALDCSTSSYENRGLGSDLEARREVDTNFIVGLFDFPMIDNTRPSGGERTAVSLTALNPSVLSVALTYFPASRASLKDKPYDDEVIRDLVRNRQSSSPLR
jgi:hypothetical protein